MVLKIVLLVQKCDQYFQFRRWLPILGSAQPYNVIAGLIQPLHACTTSGYYVNKRCSAFNASVAAGISHTGSLVQSSLYSYAVLFHCWSFWVDPNPR